MASQIPNAIADVELQLSTSISVGDTSFSLNSATDDDGNSLPAGKYCFTLNNGTSNKEYLLGQLNGTDVTSVVSVNRQGTESSGAVRAHRVGTPVILTNFATIQRVADILNGDLNLDGTSPLSYDSEPTVTDREEIATVGYVLDAASGDVSFGAQTLTGQNAGETVADGDLVYFKTSDQEWYKTDADTASTVEGVQLGIALGAGTDGAGIDGGVQISGPYTTTGLTAGSTYYASNTAGGYGTSAGTTEQVIGVALSTTKLLLVPRNPETVTTDEKDALAGGGDFGTPSSTNKFLTEEYNASSADLPVVREYTTSTTWSKPSGLKFVIVELVGPGGDGADGKATDEWGGGGGGGGYARKLIQASALGSSETVTVGSGTTASSFGSHASASAGSDGSAASSDNTIGAGGAGGVGSNGDININGQGGGAAGGNSYFGGGAPFVAVNAAGENGTNYGGGGSGGNDTGNAGGTGSDGVVLVTEYYA